MVVHLTGCIDETSILSQNVMHPSPSDDALYSGRTKTSSALLLKPQISHQKYVFILLRRYVHKSNLHKTHILLAHAFIVTFWCFFVYHNSRPPAYDVTTLRIC